MREKLKAWASFSRGMSSLGRHPRAGTHCPFGIRKCPCGGGGSQGASGRNQWWRPSEFRECAQLSKARWRWGIRKAVCILEPWEWEEPRAWLAWSQVHLRSRQSEISSLRCCEIGDEPKASQERSRGQGNGGLSSTWCVTPIYPQRPAPPPRGSSPCGSGEGGLRVGRAAGEVLTTRCSHREELKKRREKIQSKPHTAM